MIVCGIDEVGRGALAGPIVAVATILNDKAPIDKLRDSKALNKDLRIRIYDEIVESGALIRVESISVRLINKYGIGWANKEVFRRLINQVDADEYVLDGNLKVSVKSKSKKIQSVVKADATVPEVMAASIVAKVTRDRLMCELANLFNQYGWETNVGYGTKRHIEALREHGICCHHRTMFVETALTK